MITMYIFGKQHHCAVKGCMKIYVILHKNVIVNTPVCRLEEAVKGIEARKKPPAGKALSSTLLRKGDRITC